MQVPRYDYVENFAFIGDYFEDPNELIEMEKRCGVELVNLYGHFGTDVEENIKVGKKADRFSRSHRRQVVQLPARRVFR